MAVNQHIKTELKQKEDLKDLILNISIDKIAVFNDGDWFQYAGNLSFKENEQPVLELTAQAFIAWEVEEYDEDLISRYVDEIELFINGYTDLELLEWAVE